MPVFGKTLSEYIQFLKPILVLILIVGLARLFLSLAGAPNSTVKWLSLTVVTLLGALYCAIRVHTSGFGSYQQLLPLPGRTTSSARLNTAEAETARPGPTRARIWC